MDQDELNDYAFYGPNGRPLGDGEVAAFRKNFKDLNPGPSNDSGGFETTINQSAKEIGHEEGLTKRTEWSLLVGDFPGRPDRELIRRNHHIFNPNYMRRFKNKNPFHQPPALFHRAEASRRNALHAGQVIGSFVSKYPKGDATAVRESATRDPSRPALLVDSSEAGQPATPSEVPDAVGKDPHEELKKAKDEAAAQQAAVLAVIPPDAPQRVYNRVMRELERQQRPDREGPRPGADGPPGLDQKVVLPRQVPSVKREPDRARRGDVLFDDEKAPLPGHRRSEPVDYARRFAQLPRPAAGWRDVTSFMRRAANITPPQGKLPGYVKTMRRSQSASKSRTLSSAGGASSSAGAVPTLSDLAADTSAGPTTAHGAQRPSVSKLSPDITRHFDDFASPQPRKRATRAAPRNGLQMLLADQRDPSPKDRTRSRTAATSGQTSTGYGRIMRSISRLKHGSASRRRATR